LPAAFFASARTRYTEAVPIPERRSYGPQHGDHQLAGCSAGIDPLPARTRHDQTDATAIEIIAIRRRSVVLLEVCRDDRSPSCATADEAQGFLELIPPRHGGYLL
jgi:hypothetical protein